MAITRIQSSPFPMEFTGQETLIVKVGDDAKTRALEALGSLDTAGKTVVVTDGYLYDSHGDSSYRDTVRDILLSLKAKKIIFAPDTGPGEKATRQYVISALQSQGCQYKYIKSLVHDRYWYCLENGKAVVMDSLNDLGKHTSTIKTLDPDEVADLKSQLISQKVLEDEAN